MVFACLRDALVNTIPTHAHPALQSPVCTSMCSRSPARGSAARNPGSPPWRGGLKTSGKFLRST